MNSIVLKGRLTSDIEVKQTQSGVAVTKFSVAVDRDFSKEKEADFIPCTAWRQTAEFLGKFFRKGQEILLSGRLLTIKFTDKDGNNRIGYDVMVDKVEFCGSKASNGNNEQSGFTPIADESVSDDVPF